MAAQVVDILMYHSVSDAGGPTSIPPAVFADQMAALAESGVAVSTLDHALDAPGHSVVITFDDAFQDFADAAWPIMARHGFPALVYVPTAHVGHAEDWRGANRPARRLMGWPTIRRLSAEGVTFGSHTVSHPDLRSIPDDALDAELTQSRNRLQDELGEQVHHFAPPYGLSDARVRDRIAARYTTSVGTRLARARSGANRFDLPRLEMFYFTDPGRWRRHLAGQGGPYLAARQTLRAVRERLQAPWNRA